MKKPLWVYLTYPIHLATRGWLKYQCFLCCEDDEHHYGMAAVMCWFRDIRIVNRTRMSFFRFKHRKISRFLCFFGRHEGIVLLSTRLPPGSCVSCGRKKTNEFDDFSNEED